MSFRRDGAHPLQTVEHNPFNSQYGTCTAANGKRDVARLRSFTIMQKDLYVERGIAIGENIAGEFNAGQYAIILHQKLRAALLVKRNGGERAMVTIANVFIKRVGDELLQELVGNVFRSHSAKIDCLSGIRAKRGLFVGRGAILFRGKTIFRAVAVGD